jgi:hypothetical protein
MRWTNALRLLFLLWAPIAAAIAEEEDENWANAPPPWPVSLPTAQLLQRLAFERIAPTHQRVHYLTFGHGCCALAKARACEAAQPYVDTCRALDMDALDPDFRRAHAATLETARGGGLWLWKPYLINRTLHETNTQMDEGDYLLYVDAGAYLTDAVEPLLWLADHDSGVLTFGVGLPQRAYCKRDAFVRQRCDTPKCHDAMQVNGAFSVWRKSPHARRVADAWLRDCMDHASLSDAPSVEAPELDGFIAHRHDQALLTNVLTREGWPRDTTHGDAAYMIVHDRNKA